MPDSSAIDDGLLALLSGDATLMALTPDGVFWDEAPPHAKLFVIVSLVDEADVRMFGGRAYEDALYLVKAVMLKTAMGSATGSPPTTLIQQAADRIDTVLEGASLLVAGYTPMTLEREARLRMTEVDDLDDRIRWFHRGGHYRVQMSL
jgi:hypothetical protein